MYLVGMRYLILESPASEVCRSIIWPLRDPSRSTTAPTNSSGTSATASSYGSSLLPSSPTFVMTYSHTYAGHIMQHTGSCQPGEGGSIFTAKCLAAQLNVVLSAEYLAKLNMMSIEL